MSEKIVMPVLEFDPKISFQFLGERCTIRPIFIAKTVLALTAFVVHIIFLERNLLVLDSIFNLVFNVVWVSLLPCTAVYLAKHLSDDNSVYKATVEVDAQMNANIVAQRDWLLVLMAALYPCLTGSLTANTFLGEDSRYNIPYCIMSMICSSVLTVAINKYLISKRLKHLRTADAFVDRAEDTILISRRLLDLDKTLNSTYAPLAAVSVIYTFQDLLMTLYSIWTTYGAHMVLLYDPFGVYGFCTLFVVFECVVGVALAYSSSIIADEVGGKVW